MTPSIVHNSQGDASTLRFLILVLILYYKSYFCFSGLVEPPKVADVDECAVETLNDCSANSKCINLDSSYTCQCHEGNTHMIRIWKLTTSVFVPAR